MHTLLSRQVIDIFGPRSGGPSSHAAEPLPRIQIPKSPIDNVKQSGILFLLDFQKSSHSNKSFQNGAFSPCPDGAIQ